MKYHLIMFLPGLLLSLPFFSLLSTQFSQFSSNNIPYFSLYYFISAFQLVCVLLLFLCVFGSSQLYYCAYFIVLLRVSWAFSLENLIIIIVPTVAVQLLSVSSAYTVQALATTTTTKSICSHSFKNEWEKILFQSHNINHTDKRKKKPNINLIKNFQLFFARLSLFFGDQNFKTDFIIFHSFFCSLFWW